MHRRPTASPAVTSSSRRTSASLVARALFDQAVAQRDSLRAQLVTAQRNAKVASDQLRISANGVDNLAPHSFFSVACASPHQNPEERVVRDEQAAELTASPAFEG